MPRTPLIAVAMVLIGSFTSIAHGQNVVDQQAAECSAKADAQGLKGEERRIFRAKCKSETAAPPKVVAPPAQALTSPKKVRPASGARRDGAKQAAQPQVPTQTCSTGADHMPGDPEGFYGDGGDSYTITNRCECISAGIRVVGVRFLGAGYGLQVFNLSGQQRSIWASISYSDDNGAQTITTPPITLAANQKGVYYPFVASEPGIIDAVNVHQIVVLGCSG